MNAMRIIADAPTQLPTAALAIFRLGQPVCVCFGNKADSDADSIRRTLNASDAMFEALNTVKAKFYAEATFDSAGRLLVPFTCDDFAQICWALSQAEIETTED